jgi:hypothetical protein
MTTLTHAQLRTRPDFDHRRAGIDELLGERRRLERIADDRTRYPDQALRDGIADDLLKIELHLEFHRRIA